MQDKIFEICEKDDDENFKTITIPFFIQNQLEDEIKEYSYFN